MNLFCEKTAVSYFDTFSEFVSSFRPCETDLILTESFLYHSFIEPADLPCKVILKDTYDVGEPKEETVDRILLDIRSAPIQRIIAIGGGSVIDIAKVLCIQDAYPIRHVVYGETPLTLDKSLMILPTTCGTGSEVSYGGIITMSDTGHKTALIDPILHAQHAVLIAELIASLPHKIFIHCSLDALGHAMESYVSATRGNEFVRGVARQAITQILDGYGQMLRQGPEYRKNLLRNFITASCMAGIAVNNGGAGPVHALAYPVGEVYHMSHGESIYQFLTAVFSFYERSGGELLQELSEIVAGSLRKAGCLRGDMGIYENLEWLLEQMYPARPLRDCGMTESDIAPFVDNIFQAKQRLLAASYIPFTREDAAAIYRARL